MGINFWWYVGGRGTYNNRVEPPFQIPPQPENYGSAFQGNMLNKEHLTPDGKYGGYKLKWPQELKCERIFTEPNMAKVCMRDHEYIESLARHNQNMKHLNQGTQPSYSEDDDDGDGRDEI